MCQDPLRRLRVRGNREAQAEQPAGSQAPCGSLWASRAGQHPEQMRMPDQNGSSGPDSLPHGL